MPEIVNYCGKKKIICVEGFGNITCNDVINTVEKATDLKIKYQTYHVISDHSNVENIPEYLEIFNLASHVAQKLKEFHIAIINPQKFKEQYQLFVNSANVRGCNIKLCINNSFALDWINNF